MRRQRFTSRARIQRAKRALPELDLESPRIPVWYSAEEASAFVAGWNAAREAI